MVDHHFLRRDGRAYGGVRRLEGLIDRHVDAIVVSSGRAAGQLLTEFGVDPRRLFALPDCVDGAAFRPDVLTSAERAAERAALGLPAGAPVVVYLGLLAQHQGIDLLLAAARAVVDARPDTHFLVMGFPGEHIYRARAAALGLAERMVFTGRVPYGEAPRRLALGDLAVAPKISATEGSGKLLNYMAMGLPTVVFDNAVSREYLDDDGVYAPLGDAAALAQALLAVLADPGAGGARGARLRQRALALYDWEHAGERLLALYDRLALARRLEAPA
jgi:glycosyltransferase involved in cell wall biosynthesis